MALTKNETEIRIKYTVGTFQHTHTIGVVTNVLVPSPTNDIDLVPAGGGIVLASTAVPAYIALHQPLFAETDTFDSWEAWYLGDGTFSPVYLAGRSLGLNGTAAPGTAAIPESQYSFMYRATTGKVGRITMLGSTREPYKTDGRPFPNPANEAIATYLEGDSCVVYHSSNGYPAVVYKYTVTRNNAMERRIYGRG